MACMSKILKTQKKIKIKTLFELIDEYGEVTEQNQCSRVIGLLDTNELEKNNPIRKIICLEMNETMR